MNETLLLIALAFFITCTAAIISDRMELRAKIKTLEAENAALRAVCHVPEQSEDTT